MKKDIHKIFMITLGISTMFSLVGCSKLSDEMIESMDKQQVIQLSVDGNSYDVERNRLEWVELDQLNNHKNLRKVWDDKLNIIKFDRNSKNGSIYIDIDGNWSGNNTLYNAFQNKVFVNDYWNDGNIKSALAQAAMEEYSDIENENTGLPTSVNVYFNLLPDNKDGKSGMFNYITRAEAMSAIYRADTPVIMEDIDEEFENAVGSSQYNIYAQNMTDYSYLDYKNNSLNKNSYSSTITRAEVVYMIVQRYYKDEYDSLTGKESVPSDVKNAGDVAKENGFDGKFACELYELEYCLQNKDKGLTEDLYKALIIGVRHGIINRGTRWSDGTTGGELINMLLATYKSLTNNNNFVVNAKVGANAGNVLYESAVIEEEPEKQEETLGTVQVQKIRNIAKINDLIKYYGDEISMTDAEIDEAKQIADSFTIEACDKYMVVDFCKYLNVRKGPSTDYKISKSVAAGTQVHIVGICAENGWYRVIADGKICYQCGVYFSDIDGQDTTNLVQEYE